MTPEQAEKYVKERWDDSRLDHRDSNARCVFFFMGDGGKYFSSWPAAYEFTLQREREIAEKRDEIAFMVAASRDGNSAAQERILALLEAQLAELLRGFKEGKEPSK